MQPRIGIPARMLGVQWSLGFSMAKQMDRTGVSLQDANDFLVDFGISTPCSTCSVDFLKMIGKSEMRLTAPFQDWFVRARGVVAKKINRPPPTREQCESEIQTVDRPWTALFLMATTYPAVGQMQYYEKEIEALRRLFLFCGQLWPSWNEEHRQIWMDALASDYKTAPVLRSRTALLEFMIKQLVNADPDTAQRLGWYSVLNYQNWLNGQLQQQQTTATNLDTKHGVQTAATQTSFAPASSPKSQKKESEQRETQTVPKKESERKEKHTTVPKKEAERREKQTTVPKKEAERREKQSTVPKKETQPVSPTKKTVPVDSRLQSQKNKSPAPAKVNSMNSTMATDKHHHTNSSSPGKKKCVKKPVPIACFVLNLCIAIGIAIGSVFLPAKVRYILLSVVLALLVALVVYHFL